MDRGKPNLTMKLLLQFEVGTARFCPQPPTHFAFLRYVLENKTNKQKSGKKGPKLNVHFTEVWLTPNISHVLDKMPTCITNSAKVFEYLRKNSPRSTCWSFMISNVLMLKFITSC